MIVSKDSHETFHEDTENIYIRFRHVGNTLVVPRNKTIYLT